LPFDAAGYVPIRSQEEEAAVESLRQRAKKLRAEVERAKMGKTPDYEHGEPKPIPNNGPSMHDLVIEDMQKRKEFGLKKYSTLLQAFNGRRPLQDMYEELIDFMVYLQQYMYETDNSTQGLQSADSEPQPSTRPEDPMPTFTFKAQDKYAAGAILYYMRRLDEDMLYAQTREVNRALTEFEGWQERNPDKMKAPDHFHVPVTPPIPRPTDA
jgi:hypothetical protein